MEYKKIYICREVSCQFDTYKVLGEVEYATRKNRKLDKNICCKYLLDELFAKATIANKGFFWVQIFVEGFPDNAVGINAHADLL